MRQFDALIQDQQPFLSTLPGDHYHGDITGHGVEWRTQLTLDSCPSDETEEQENQYDLTFALIEDVEGRAVPILSLDYWVAEVGVNDTHKFTVSTPDDLMAQIARVCDTWDMHKDSLPIAKTLVDKIFMLKERDPEIFVKDPDLDYCS